MVSEPSDVKRKSGKQPVHLRVVEPKNPEIPRHELEDLLERLALVSAEVQTLKLRILGYLENE